MRKLKYVKMRREMKVGKRKQRRGGKKDTRI